MCPREKGFVLWGHCQNLFDDPRMYRLQVSEWSPIGKGLVTRLTICSLYCDSL